MLCHTVLCYAVLLATIFLCRLYSCDTDICSYMTFESFSMLSLQVMHYPMSLWAHSKAKMVQAGKHYQGLLEGE